MPMTVKRLKKLLEYYDEDAEVGFAYHYGDYCKTMMVSEIENVDQRDVKYSDYYGTYKLVEEGEEEQLGRYDANETNQMIVLL